jgi:hypothetical protein
MMKGGAMPQIDITDEQLAGLEKWAEYFFLPLEKTIQVILDTALADLDTGSPLFFRALEPEPPMPIHEDWMDNL